MKLHSKLEILNQVREFLDQNSNGVVEILGPTASGKTSFSVELAKQLAPSEIISVDSRQVYRECDISAAKITREEMGGVVHHGIDLVDPDEDFSVVIFQDFAFKMIEDIQSRDILPILCGGTMLWLDAVSENYVFSQDPNPEAPEAGQRGQFLKSEEKSEPKWPVLKIGLHWDRALLYERINQRAVTQFEAGLIEETERVLKAYPNPSPNFLTSFGYLEINQYLSGEISYEEALSNNQQRNRNYAKRQDTWWRGREDVVWVDASTL